MKLSLTKDLKDYRAVFYWTNREGKRLSPMLPTLVHAYEWHLLFQRWVFKGTEKRKTKVDRRFGDLFSGKRRKYERRQKPMGRRSSDTSLTVVNDLYSEKIAWLKKQTFIGKQQIPQRLSA